MAESKKKSTAKKTTKKVAPKTGSANKTAAAKNTKKQATKVAPVAAEKSGSVKGKADSKKDAPKSDSKKSVSANAKEGNNSWMIISVVLGIIIILLIASIGIVYNNNKNDVPVVGNETMNNESNNPVGGEVKLLIVEDASCDSCQVDLFATQVKENLISDLEYEKISYDSNEGKAIIEALDSKQVPVYLFTENMQDRDDWDELSGAFIPVELSGVNYFMLNPQFIPNKVLIEAPEITDSAIVIGDANAPVTLIEFTDFECPFCAIAEGNKGLVEQFKAQNPTYVPPMPEVLKEYVENGDVKIVFYNYPIAQLHPQARGAHNAALCANDQGKFEEYSRMLWDEREEWTSSANRKVVYMDYAKELGLDESAFETCIDDETFDSQIDEELALGQTYGVSGTPAFFIGRTFISGAQDFEVFKVVIDDMLNK